ncbi:hypothetical protein LXL04_039881 [Taraxacum kok-saghyz]
MVGVINTLPQLRFSIVEGVQNNKQWCDLRWMVKEVILKIVAVINEVQYSIVLWGLLNREYTIHGFIRMHTIRSPTKVILSRLKWEKIIEEGYFQTLHGEEELPLCLCPKREYNGIRTKASVLKTGFNRPVEPGTGDESGLINVGFMLISESVPTVQNHPTPIANR